MTFTTPSAQTWTLRLKSQKTTVLLHVDPLQTFPTIKEQLYKSLEETGLKNADSEPISLPPSPSDIELGRPVNTNDPHKGFQLGEWEYSSLEEEGEDPKGKGKAKAGRPKKSGTVGADSVKDCPKGAGLRDGAVLAFRWKGNGSREDEDIEMADGRKADMWDVKLASYEDNYGVENEMDVGGGREFEG
ncbi:uncharacterized protein N0V89_007372 [Didymosphaeria variabile]|uniref:Uncharacterized protein n=1 Tax=Didymosphaeria variabile TaxID=1932322 RepID=A0A9W8XKR6_9PLEO|nr:uncharacterized protein N0V89_007372 [Didymosphaeria variabile]KAJ4352026.1 hypothetical protein N0V89_007372 [Didymosphaeria variabile]